jgi:ATP-binding cassette, subfamily C, bacterial LapB
MTDPSLAKALLRIGALQGVVLQEAELVSVLAGPDGEGKTDCPSDEALRSAWESLVPGGSLVRKPLRTLEVEDFPALLDVDGEWRIVRRRDGKHWLFATAAGERLQADAPLDGEAIVPLAPTEARARGEAARAKQRNSVSWFWREIQRHLGTFAEVGVASFAANLLALAASLFAMQVYDRVVPNLAYQTLWVLAGGVAIAIFLEMLIRAARAQLLDHACKKIDLKLSDSLFRHLLSIRMNARPQALGTLAAQIRDFEVVRNFLTSSTLFAIADAPFVILFLFVMWIVGGWIVVVPVIALILTLILGVAAQWPLRRLSQLHVNETNERNGLLIEAIDGAEMIKATGAEWQMARQWNSLSEQLSADGLKMRGVSNLMTGSANAIQQVAYAAIVVLGTYLIGEGALTVGGLVACSILSGRVLAPVVQVVSLAFQWNYARVALKTLDGLMALPVDGPQDGRPVMKESFAARLGVDNLAFQYGKDGPPVIAVPRLQFVPGERVAILGPTGSGKSTLLKLLSGLYTPTQGRVLFDGIDMTQLNPRQIRRSVGYLPQEVRLFQGSLRDNLSLGLVPPSDEEIFAVAAITGVDRLIKQHPKGMGLTLSEGGRGLSGGQKQAVGLTRALLGHPKLILLDEPTAAMDQALELHTVHSLLRGLSPEQTLICVTHKPAVLHAMDRLVILDRGRVVLDGPRDEVLKRLNAPQGAGSNVVQVRA